MPQLDQRKVFYDVLKFLSDDFLNSLDSCDSESSPYVVSAATSLICNMVGDSESLRNHLVVWLTGSSGAGLGDAVGIRRAVVCAVSQDKDTIAAVLEKSLSQFGDELYIKHSPILQQEGTYLIPVLPHPLWKYLTFGSARASPVTQRWICPPACSHEASFALEIGDLAQDNLSSVSRIAE